LQQALDQRGLVMGPQVFEVQNRDASKVFLDDSGKLHWPVMFVYEEYAQVDFIEDFVEDSALGDHLDVMFPENEYPDWDTYKKYGRADIEVYAILNQVAPYDQKKKIRQKTQKNSYQSCHYFKTSYRTRRICSARNTCILCHIHKIYFQRKIFENAHRCSHENTVILTLWYSS